MSALVPFEYGDHQVRTVVVDGEPWFVANDVCSVLNIRNSRDAVSRLEDDEKSSVVLTDGTPGNPMRTIINEAGLYDLIGRSDKPEARLFRRWVNHEVLPTIRKTGSYSIKPQSTLDVLAAAVAELQRVDREAQQAQQVALEASRTAVRAQAEVQTVSARLGLLEDQEGWVIASGFLRTKKARWPDHKILRLGRAAGKIGRNMGLEPGTYHHPRFNCVNTWPLDVWEEAYAAMTTAEDGAKVEASSR
jgi:prophage antirepressor-like protein